MRKQLNLSIAIAAYNAEKNIEHMLESLLRQKEGDDFSIGEIIVHCDNCIDETVTIANSFRNAKILVINKMERKGFAGSVKAILEICGGDICILLNDDIKINDDNFIKKLIIPFEDDTDVGLVSGNPQPLPPINFVERAVISSFHAYENMRIKINNGNTNYTCDGKILALSREFKDKLFF